MSYRTGMRGPLEALETIEPSGRRVTEPSARLERLCDRMALEQPRVVFTNLGEPNAFAMSGPDGGIVVFDIGLFSLLDDDQLEAILTHELAHHESYDGLVDLFAFIALQTVMSVVSLGLFPVLLFLAGLARATAWLRGAPSTWTRSLAWRLRTLVVGIVMVVPAVFTFVLLVRSRRREYAADAAPSRSPATPKPWRAPSRPFTRS